MGTCMPHMRGGMGSGETYTRPEEQQSGEEEGRCVLFFRGVNVGVVEAGGVEPTLKPPQIGETFRIKPSDRSLEALPLL